MPDLNQVCFSDVIDIYVLHFSIGFHKTIFNFQYSQDNCGHMIMRLFADSKFQTNLSVDASFAEIVDFLSVIFNSQQEVLDIQFAKGLW